MTVDDADSIERPTDMDVESYAERLGLSLTDAEVDAYRELIDDTLNGFSTIAAQSDRSLPHRARKATDRPADQRPTDEEDPLNAWIRYCNVDGAATGPLDGLTVGLKDTIALADYPLTAGSAALAEFVPSFDATVVHRLLDAGATIVGKQNMESFAFSGSGDMSDFGPVFNPHSSDHLSGGSSGGSAAAVARGDCDVSIGGDQAGSIRIPSACCGVVGLKPTTGLVPYTGAFPLDLSIDSLGPIAANVKLVARTLEVIAGEDIADSVRLDPRQPHGVTADDYTADLDAGIQDITIGALEEGFDWGDSDPTIDGTVRDAVTVLDDAGATIRSVSLPNHRLLSSAAGGIASLGGARSLLDAGECRGTDGWYWTGLTDALDDLLDMRPEQLPPSIKRALLTAEHITKICGHSIYGAAQNIAIDGERRYNHLLETYDALVMPTTIVPPLKHDPSLDLVDTTNRGRILAANTAVMNLTGHPAVSVPCGTVDDLPVGMMLIGSHFDEATLLRIAASFESATDWRTR